MTGRKCGGGPACRPVRTFETSFLKADRAGRMTSRDNVDRDIQRKVTSSQARRADRRHFQDPSVFWDWPGWFLSLESSFPAPGGSWQPRAEEPANRTPPEIVEKVLHLRRTFHRGPIRIVWYLARYHDGCRVHLDIVMGSVVPLEIT